MNNIIIAIIGSGALGAVLGGVVSWLLNRKLFEAEVEHTVTQSASEAVTMYRSWSNDLLKRLDDLEAVRRRDAKRIGELEADTARLKVERREYTGRTRMMARVLVVILHLLDGAVNTNLCDIATDANISPDDIQWLRRIMDEVIEDVELPSFVADTQ